MSHEDDDFDDDDEPVDYGYFDSDGNFHYHDTEYETDYQRRLSTNFATSGTQMQNLSQSDRRKSLAARWDSALNASDAPVAHAPVDTPAPPTPTAAPATTGGPPPPPPPPPLPPPEFWLT